jgi:TPP-dependent indolepyruvate ferredoxin oxidoreductase alpha subunit
LFELEVSGPVCVDGWPEEIASVAYLIVVESYTSFVEEQIEKYSQKEA